jgi:hypothetical protein
MEGTLRCTIDHTVIRRWAEERHGKPGRFLRIHLPGYSSRAQFTGVSWDCFFAQFEAKQLAFVYQERSAAGGLSSFYRLVHRLRAEPPLQANGAMAKPDR